MGENEQKPVEPAGEMNEPVIESAPKSKKTGIIVAGVVVALGLGGFGVAYAMDAKPENVAMSAVSDFLNTKAMSVDGVFEVSQESSEMGVKLELKTNNTESRNASTDATLSVNYGGEDIKISLGSVVLKDYTIYIKLDGLKDATKKALELAGSTEYSQYVDLYEDLIDAVVGEIDGVWWKISIPELVDDIDDMASSDKNKTKEAWQCVIDAADKATEKQSKYADIYKDNAFVSLKEYKGDKKSSAKGSAYTLELDAAKLTSFSNTMVSEVDDLGVTDCLKKAGASTTKSEVKELKEDDVKKAIEEFPEIVLTIDNGFFSHKLTGLYVDFSENGYTGKIDFTFSRDVKAVSAPTDAKPITEVVENVTEYKNMF